MKIVHVIWTRFPVEGYGGTERVAYWLGKAQAEMGHEVTYLCLPGSKLPFAQTLALPERMDQLDALLPAGTDMVQLYGTPNFKIEAPHLINIGGNGSRGEKFFPNTVFVSKNHAERHHWTEYVYNGIDLSEYPFAPKQKSASVLFLAKASWRVKNLKGAIAIAREAGLTLRVAGGRAGFWYRGVDSCGIVDGAKKLALLAEAKLLLFPVIWDEPFGLAVVEALASGVPVVATPRGALPEIITPQCGVLANSHEELVEAVRSQAHQLDAGACRARVESEFTHRKMAEKYLFYYERIRKHGVLRQGAPYAAPDADSQKKIYYKNYKAAWI